VLDKELGLEVVSIWHKDKDLQCCSWVFLPGGFSYGDYLRSGAIARFSPVMQTVIDFAKGGGFVMGICNGFQILTESGLLPGALLRNIHTHFVCKNVYITPDNQSSPITKGLGNKAYKIPIAHAEGNYYCDNQTLTELEVNQQILFRYCDEDGKVTPESNPNGSLGNIAGICNKEGNVFGMMPHPERAASVFLNNSDGRRVLEGVSKIDFLP